MKAKNGISLIVLVITIVVIIILAAAVILSLGDNNPINDSKVANLSSTQDSIQSAMVNAIGSRLAKNATVTSDTYTLLTSGTAILETAEQTSATLLATSTTIEGLYAIASTGWDELNVKQPANGTWYYSVKTGKVYVDYPTDPPYAADSDTYKAFALGTVTPK